MKAGFDKRVRLQKVNLYQLTASRNDLKETDKEHNIVIQLEPIIEDENDDTITLLCKLELGNDHQPFTISVVTKAIFKKAKTITGSELLENFWGIAPPILSEMSLSVAQVISAMGYPTLIISPHELMRVISESDDKNAAE